MYAIEYYSSVKKNELIKFAGRYMELKNYLTN